MFDQKLIADAARRLSVAAPYARVITEDEVEQWREVRGSLIHTALSEGRPLGGSSPLDHPSVMCQDIPHTCVGTSETS
jgi:hypothetical protein